jgi:hypothetical protein
MDEKIFLINPQWAKGILAVLLFGGCFWLRYRARFLDENGRVRALWILAPTLPAYFLTQDWAFARWPWNPEFQFPAQALSFIVFFFIVSKIATPSPGVTQDSDFRESQPKV